MGVVLDADAPESSVPLDQSAETRGPVEVTVRLFFAAGKVEILAGRAEEWVHGRVLVSVDDDRVPDEGVWVRASDVERVRPTKRSDVPLGSSGLRRGRR